MTTPATLQPNPERVTIARARRALATAAVVVPANILSATLTVRKAIDACRDLDIVLLNTERLEGETDDDFRARALGDRYHEMVLAAAVLAQLHHEMTALAEITARFVTESSIMPDDGPETWLRDHGHANLEDIVRDSLS